MSTATTSPVSASDLIKEFLQVRSASASLAAPLSAEDQMLQSMPDASPVKWHLAHTTWFFETFILCEYLSGYVPFNEEFRKVFNSYYKQLGDHPDRARRGLFSRPSLDEVMRYRSFVEEHMLRLIDGAHSPEASKLLVLGMQHEQQHQELILTDIKHALWSQPLQPAYHQLRGKYERNEVQRMWVPFEGGIHKIGFEGDGFCFDSELPRHEVLLQSFRMASRLTTNRDYLEFMNDGGYRNPSLWLSEGWDAVCRERWESPSYWERNGGDWRVFTLQGWKAVDVTEPVCNVSYYEADAFARWAGARLPLESEWEFGARGLPVVGNFVESGNLHPISVAASGKTLHQMFGDVWEWTSSPYTAYPGYRPEAGAIGEYNGKFMCNQYVLRGGSCATPEAHVRASYRNFFPAHARWQFTGIRLASDDATD